MKEGKKGVFKDPKIRVRDIKPYIASGMLGEKVGQPRSLTTIHILLTFRADFLFGLAMGRWY